MDIKKLNEELIEMLHEELDKPELKQAVITLIQDGNPEYVAKILDKKEDDIMIILKNIEGKNNYVEEDLIDEVYNFFVKKHEFQIGDLVIDLEKDEIVQIMEKGDFVGTWIVLIDKDRARGTVRSADLRLYKRDGKLKI